MAFYQSCLPVLKLSTYCVCIAGPNCHFDGRQADVTATGKQKYNNKDDGHNDDDDDDSDGDDVMMMMMVMIVMMMMMVTMIVMM